MSPSAALPQTTNLPSLRLLLLGGLLGALVACSFAVCPAALADDDTSPAGGAGAEPSAVSQLEAKEIEYLKKKFSEWEQLDPRRKEHIARNVLRLRGMSAEEREKLKERMARIRGRGHGKTGRGHSRSGFIRSISAVGARLVERLPPEGKAEVERVDGRPSGVKMTLFRLVSSKAAEAEGFEFRDEELAALPKAMQAKVRDLLEQANDESDARRAAAARSKLSHVRVHGKIESLRKRLGKDASPEQFVDAVMATWASTIEAVMAEIAADPKRFGEMLEQKMRHGESPQDHARSVLWIERVALRKWRDDPAAQAAADKVVRRLLVDELGVQAEALADLPGYDQPRERLRALEKVLGGTRAGRSWGRAGRDDRHRPGRKGADRQPGDDRKRRRGSK